MNLINANDGCCIRGENNGVLHYIYQSYVSLVDAQKHHGRNSMKEFSPWWGLEGINSGEYARKLVRSFVEEVIRPGRHDKICGFKEIRYSPDRVPDLVGYVDFLDHFFPNARFVFNHRNLDDVAKSKWWASMPDAPAVLREFDDRLRQFDSSSNVFHFSYDTALKERLHVKNLFEFLGVPYDKNLVEGVFLKKHSY